MKKTDYITPDEHWLLQEFEHIPFGIIRPAELEIILGFFIIYHNGTDIEESEYFLAQKYKITESKAKRFKIEFAKRYAKNRGQPDEIARILSRLFETTQNPFEFNEDSKTISFMVKDPYDLKLIKENMDDNRIVHRGDFNGKLISLSLDQFMRFMSLHYKNLCVVLKPLINEKLDETAKSNSAFWKALSTNKKVAHILKTIAPTVVNGIVSLVTGFAVK
ncbi:MAG: hypothetical protein LBR23_05040 [Spirochaetaceae bacterium]|jgi:hypothetical protein|nr:hypothetical protein [Spirochaetaceae bacterium]